MNAAELLAHFDRIADAPDAVPRLRRFVLDLAVRGKLVPQDPSDEPAAELLNRIAAEKARLIKAGEFRKQKTFPPNGEENLPFQFQQRGHGADWPKSASSTRGLSLTMFDQRRSCQ